MSSKAVQADRLSAKRDAIKASEDLARLAADLGRAARSAATVKAYQGDWRRFAAWCMEEGHGPLPATPQVIGLYVASLVAGVRPKAQASLARAVSAIADRHRMAGHALDRRHPAIADVLKGAGRLVAKPKRQARPLVADDIRKLLVVCDDSLVGRRNRALILVGFFGALRGSELVGIAVEHLQESTAGYTLTIPQSKADQEREGQVIGLPRQKDLDLCPVRALKSWLVAADLDAGPVFFAVNAFGKVESFADPLTDRSLRRILKQLAKRAGFSAKEVGEISSHSLRAGHITTGYEKDVPEWALQRQARHANPKTTRGYNRTAVFNGNSGKGLLD